MTNNCFLSNKNNKHIGSLFKLALQGPTKLYYFGKAEYKSDQVNDAFLEALKEKLFHRFNILPG